MGPGAISFADVITPLSKERFLCDYWTRKFLHLKGAKGRFTPLLTWDNLNQVLEWQNPPPFVKLTREGNRLDPAFYTDFMDSPPEARQLNVGRLIAALSQGAGLVIDGIQKNVPAIRSLSDQFETMFRAANQVNLYAGWGTQNTFHLHWDPQEVFVLQLSGRKRWKIYAPTRPYPFEDESEKAPQPSGPPTWEGVVEDGDLLYVPRGWWHIVHPLGEPSLHLNLGIETATGRDFLRWWLPRLLRHPELRQDLPLAPDAAAGEAWFARLLEVMTRDGEGQNIAGEFLREWDAYRRVQPPLRLPGAPAEQAAPFTMATKVRLAQRDALFIQYRPGERTAKFHAVGGQYDAAPQIIPALQRLSGSKSISLTDLCAGLDDRVIKDVIAALEVMADAGVLLKESPAG